MFEGMYYFYLIMGFTIALIGVIASIRKIKRERWGRNLQTLGYKSPFSEWVAVMGEPDHVGSYESNGERRKSATWSSGGATITIGFDKEDRYVEVIGSSVQM